MNRVIKFGFDAKLYVCAAGIGGTPTWKLVKGVKNVTLNLGAGEADVSVRDSNFKLTAAALLDASIEFELAYRPSADGYDELETAYFGQEPVGLAVMDGDITTAGSRGLWADCAILNFGRDESLENAMGIKVTAKPTLTDNAPLWKEVTAS